VTQPWQIIESIDTDEGILELRKRGESDYLITIAGRVLMNSFANRSEILLSELACSPHRRAGDGIYVESSARCSSP
jgi:hypothetical protein